MLARASPLPPLRKRRILFQIVKADPKEFSRCLNISSDAHPAHTSPRQFHSSAKLFNPPDGPDPNTSHRRTIIYLGATSSSYALRGWSANSAAHQCDHCKDDPMRFAVLARPPSTNSGWPTLIPKHSNNYVSTFSSTSSYVHSMASFGFTLSSGTTGNSSVLFDRKPSEEPGSNASAVQLKRLALGYFRIGDESFERGSR